MALITLDPLDRELIRMLGRDARVSNRRIANELGVTEGTVRGRIKRLQEEGLLAFTAIMGFEIARKSLLAFINVQADAARVREVAANIAQLPLINAVLLTMGQFNITAMCLFEELDLLLETASDGILSIEGVHHIETSIAVRTVKYNALISKVGPPQSSGAVK